MATQTQDSATFGTSELPDLSVPAVMTTHIKSTHACLEHASLIDLSQLVNGSCWFYNLSTANTTSASDDRSAAHSIPSWQVVLLGLLTGLISLVTVAGNLVVLLSFILERSIRQPTYYFIASLAVSDLLIGALSMPFYSVYLLAGKKWPMGEVICDLWLSVDYTVCLCSIYTVFCITIDRYCSVKIPAKYRKWRTERKVVAMVALTWLIPIVIFFTTIFGWQYFVGHRTVAEMECYVQYMDSAVFNCLLQVGYFWTTLVVMCALYSGIYRIALGLQQKSKARQKKLESVVTSSNRDMNRVGGALARNTRFLQQRRQDQLNEEEEENRDTEAETTEALLSSECCNSSLGVDLIDVDNKAIRTSIRRSLKNLEGDERTSSPTLPSDTELSSCQSPPALLPHERSAADGSSRRRRRRRQQQSPSMANTKRNSSVAASSRLLQLHYPPSERLRRFSQAFFNIHIGRGGGGEKGGGEKEGEASVEVGMGKRRSGQEVESTSDDCDWNEERGVRGKASFHQTPVDRGKKIMESKKSRTDCESCVDSGEEKGESNSKKHNDLRGDVRGLAYNSSCLTWQTQVALAAEADANYSSDDQRGEASPSASESPVWKRQSGEFVDSSTPNPKSRLETVFSFIPTTKQTILKIPITVPTEKVLESEESRTSLLPSTFATDEASIEKTEGGCVVPDTSPDNRQETEQPRRQNSNGYKRNRRIARLKLLTEFSVRRPNKSLMHHRQRRDFEEQTASRRGEDKKKRKSKSENRAKKALRTITIILGVFIICWTPWHVLSLVLGFWSDTGPLAAVYDISYWLCYLNSPVNPLCYALANQQFKKTFTRIIKLDWRRT